MSTDAKTITIHGGTGGTGGAANQQGGHGGIGQGPEVHFSGPISVHLPQADDYYKIMDFVSPLNFFPRQQQVYETWQKDTGTWLLEHPKFLEWQIGTPAVLWCSGIPGSGKTVLASLVVHNLRDAENSDVGVACIYMDYKESSSQTEKHILGAIWRQLATTQDLQAARPIQEKHSKQQTAITLEETQNLLRISAACFSRVYVILDALDEYGSEDKDGLVDNILGIGENIKLLVTTRTHLSPPGHVDAVILEIHPADDDIQTYVLTRLATSRKLKRLAEDNDLKTKILQSMISKARGMFLVVKLQMDLLGSVSTKDALLKVLKSLPATLHETYIRTLQYIKLESSSENIGLSALQWVAFTKRPLSLHELQAALAISSTNSHIIDNASLVQQEDILEACHGLIVISNSERGQVFRLVHYSTQEFLDQAQATEFPEAHISISRTLLTCLQWAAQSVDWPEFIYMKYKKFDFQSHPLLVYSQYILAHLKGQAETVLRTEIIATFQTLQKYPYWSIAPWDFRYLPIPLTVIWIAVAGNLLHLVASLLDDPTYGEPSSNIIVVASRYGFQEMLNILQTSGVAINNEDLHMALQQAAEGGHRETVSYWLARGADINHVAHGKTPLHAAVEKDYGEMIQVLLKANTDLNVVVEKYGTALQAAALGEKLDILKLLLLAGADPDMVGGEYGTPLQAAAYKGYYLICEALLENNANVNLVAGIYGTALRAAVETRKLEIVELLLIAGADPNLVGGHQGTALRQAAHSGNNRMCEALLKAKADVNLVPDDCGTSYGTPLTAAASAGHLETLQLLLTAGADPDLVGGQYGTALQAAAGWGQIEICKALLEANANVNLLAGRYDTALQAAVQNRELEVVKLLLTAGADSNLAGENGETALQAAAYRGYTEICEALLEANPDVNLVAGRYGTALRAAALTGQLEIVKILLTAGADPNTVGGKYGAALYAAAYTGESQICDILLRANADVNLVTSDYGTALQAAARSEDLKTLQILLTAGANPNLVGGQYGTALQAAAQDANPEALQVLLTAGADPNLVGGEYGTALQAAAYWGYYQNCEALLKAKADVNLVAGRYGTSLQAAVYCARLETVKLLLTAGADPNLVAEKHGTALCAAADRGQLQIVKLLLEYKAHVNLIGAKNSTALQAASLQGHEEIVQVLIAAGAEQDSTTKYDESDPMADWSDTASTGSTVYYSFSEEEL